MNNQSNPFVPQGSFLEPKAQGRARVKLAVLFVVTINVVGLLALLAQGCRRQEAPQDDFMAMETNEAPIFDPSTAGIDTNVSLPPYVPPTDPLPTTLPTLPAVTTEYSVVSGDNLTRIANRFGVTVKAIQDANPNVDPNRLQIGQKLMIPAPVPTTPSTSPMGVTPDSNGGAGTYTVKSGDTLSGIATQYKTTVRAIRTANPQLTSDRIIVGQRLTIPAAQ
jgi:LysM repeat protein